MSEESGEKKEVLRTIVLLLVGFVAGFATHAYVLVSDSSQGIDVVEGEINLEGDTDASDVVSATATESADSSTGEQDTTEDEYIFNAIPNNVSLGEYSISVTDQEAGSVAYISQLDLPNEAWIAVREDREGTLGNILGAGWYPAGKNSGVVELLRDTEEDSVYYVVVYIDNGDKEFDHTVDQLVTDDQNNILVTKFRTY